MRRWAYFCAIAIPAFGCRLGPALDRFRTCPDAIAYIDIARNLAADRGFVSGIKLNFVDRSDVVHHALFDWPPLYPLFVGTLTRIGIGEIGLQVVNALLMAIAAGLVFLISERIFDRATGLAAGVCASAAAIMFRPGITALADPLGLVLALLGVFAALCAHDRVLRWVVVGLLVGAAHLTKYPHAVVLAVLVWNLMADGQRRSAAACALGFSTVAAPFAVWRCALYGSPFACAQVLHYFTPAYTTVVWTDATPSVHLPEMVSFAKAAGSSFFINAANLFVGSRGLFVLTLGLLASFVFGRRPLNTVARRFVLTTAAASYAVHALTWSIPPVRGSRFMLLAFCLFLPFVADGIVCVFRRCGIYWRLAAAGVCLCALAASLWGAVTAAHSTSGEMGPAEQAVIDWVFENIAPTDVVASNNPWIVNYSTARPAVSLPRSLDQSSMQEFVEQYNVKAIVVFKGGSKRASITPKGFVAADLGSAVAAKRVDAERATRVCGHGPKAYDGTSMTGPRHRWALSGGLCRTSAAEPRLTTSALR